MNDDDINRVELRGRLTKDPVMRYTPRGTAVANAGLATNRWTAGPNGKRQELTEWHDLVLWEGLAKQIMAAQLAKGDPLHVRGRLQTRSWEGQDGQKRRSFEVIVEEIVPTRARPSAPALDEEVPFQ